jgi:hypothetical protein
MEATNSVELGVTDPDLNDRLANIFAKAKASPDGRILRLVRGGHERRGPASQAYIRARDVDTAIELCAIAEERATAEALKVRITAMHERVVAVVAKLAPAVPLVSASPESGDLLPLAARATLAHGIAEGWPAECFEPARGIESEGRK